MVLESVVSSVLNQILSAYVENFNPNQLNVGIWGGDIKLKNLKLKRGALDKFRLPIDVVEGSIGSLVLTVPWTALGSRPVKAAIDNIYLLAVPSSENKFDPEDDERRKQATKMEKLKNSELLLSSTAGTPGNTSTEEAEKNESFVAAMTNKILDNLQLRIKNVHVRYEDKISVPGHPFSIGLTVAELSAVSTDENFRESFIVGSKAGVHKLTSLDSLAIYFNTDSISLSHLAPEQFQKRFTEMISRSENSDSEASTLPDHQYILKPVSGEGKLVLRKHPTKDLAKINYQLTLSELAFLIDADQYRDALSCLDLFHFYTRRREFLRFHPGDPSVTENKARALWSFAIAATKHEVHQRAYKWTWDCFRQRRDDRKLYISLFQAAQLGTLALDSTELDDLEKRLSYQDIRYYRSLARSEMRQQRITAKHQQTNSNDAKSTSWLGWIWGGSKGPSDQEDPNFQSDSVLNEEDKRKLYEAIEWDEKEATSSAIDLPRDAIMMNIQTKLKRGSFTLRSGKLSISSDDRSAHDIISLVFDGFSADALQRTDNMELGLSLVGFRVYDGTIKNSKHPQIVRVKERQSKPLQASHQSQSELKEQSASRDHHNFFTADDPFFYLKLEHKPLDERADNAVILTMKHMEIIYHPGYVEDVVNFFQPPASQLESVGALINVASETLEGIRQDTRAGFVFALQTHKTVDIKVDINAPIIIIPQDVTLHDCQHIILDAGHISVFSNLVPPEHLKSIKFKQNRRYSDVDFMQLESMMYDQFRVELKDTQLLLGKSLEQCLSALDEPKGYAEIHLIERISLSFNVFNCIVDNTPSLTRFKVQGDLPQLRVNFSDNKYRILMSMIEVALPRFISSQGSAGHASLNKLENFPADPNNVPPKSTQSKKAGFGMSSFFLDDSSSSFDLSDDAQGNESIQQTTNTAQEDEFFEVPELLQEEQSLNFRRNNFQLQFTVGKLILSISKSNKETGEDQKLVDSVLEGFFFCLTLRDFDMSVEITLSSMYISDGLIQRNNTTHPAFKNLVSSEILEGSSDDKNDLVKFKFTQVQANHPEFMLAYEGISKIVDADLSTINISVTRPTILELFDWIISTFTNSSTSAQATEVIPPTAEAAFQAVSPQHDMSSDKMRVKVKMRTIVFLLNDDGARIATLSLNSADFSILFNGSTMRVKARLGNLTVHDDTAQTQHAKFRSLVEIQGDDLADLQYETFSRDGCVTYPGYDSMVYLRSGSIQFTLVEDTCHRILVFFSKFAQMKAVMDTARQAARQQASGFTQTTSKIHYDVLIRTPIIIFPLHKASTDCLIAHLGEISASNAFASDENKLVTKAKAGIHNIRLTSEMHHEGQLQTLQLLVDVNIDVRLASFNKEQQNQDSDQGLDTDIVAQMSDVKINLTQPQYFALMSLVTSVPKIFDFSELNQESLSHTSSPGLIQVTAASATTDLIPEIAPVAKTADGEVVSLWTTMELAFTVTNVTLELFDAMIAATETTRNNSVAKFSLNGIRVNWKFQSDRSMASEILFKAFRTIDTRTWKTTKFREIIPVADHDGDQLVLSYNQSAANSNVMLELNSPNVILSLDFLFSITAFFTQPHSQSSDLQRTRASHQRTSKSTLQDDQLASNFSYRIDILKPKLTLISDPEKSDSDAVYLIIEKILVAQQKALIAAISHMNMSFGTMNDRQSSVNFLDGCTMNFSMSNAFQAENASILIQAHTTPLVLKLSYRDFLLIYSVYCKALDFSHAPHQGKNQKDSRPTTPKTISESLSISSTSQPTAATNITTYSQKLSLKVDKLQVVLIGDLHEQPLFDLNTQTFELNAYDWSDQLSLDTSIILAINYYNLTNSHWEPLMEAWPIAFRISCLGCPSYHSVALESKRRLEMNITATFIDLIMTGADIWGREGENVLHQKRGMVSPYLIKNLTGYPLKVSAESEDEFRKGKEYLVEDGKSIPWRFEDWKLMRESVMSPTQSKLRIVLDGARWEAVSGISVVRESDEVYPLRPSLDGVTHRLLCHVAIRDTVKEVTFRSTFQVQNNTSLPIEMCVVDDAGSIIRQPYNIVPGGLCSVPIEAAYHQRIKIRPDPGFGFKWCKEALTWKDLVKHPVRTIACQSIDLEEPARRFTAATIYDEEDSTVRYYPKITLRLRAPIEIENLLPFNIQFYVYMTAQEHTYAAFLRRGGSSPVHIVDTMDLLLLGVEFQDDGVVGLKRSEYAIVNTNNPEDFPVENRLIMEDEDGLKIKLGLHFMRYPLSGGAFKIQIYCPYVIINKTGLDFSIRSKPLMRSPKSVAGQNLCGNASRRKEPRPFLFSHLEDDKRNGAVLRVGDSNWSKAINFDVVGANQQVTMQTSTKTSEYRVGLNVSEGLGKYNLTKVVIIYPRFIIKNNAKLPICLREDVSDNVFIIKPGKRVSLSLFNNSANPQLVIAFESLVGKRWSKPFQIQDVGKVYVRVADPLNSETLVHVEILLQGPSIFIKLNVNADKWPFLIRNKSSCVLHFGQTVINRSQKNNYGIIRLYESQPDTEISYAWDEPAAGLESLIRVILLQRRDQGESSSKPLPPVLLRDVHMLEVGQLEPVRTQKKGHKLAFDVVVAGEAQVLVISDYNEATSVWKVAKKNEPNTQLQSSDTVSSIMDSGFEATTITPITSLAASINLEGIGISIIDKRLRELIYASFRGIEITYEESQLHKEYRIIVCWIQLDNQLDAALFPVLFRPTDLPIIPQDAETRPTLQINSHVVKDDKHGVVYIKYATVLLQKMSLEMDESFVLALMRFAKFSETSWNPESINQLTMEPELIPEPDSEAGGLDLYFELLHLQPFVIVISFERQESVDVAERTFDSRNPLYFLLNAVTMAIGTISGAPLTLNQLKVENARMSQGQLITRLIQHYQNEGLSQLYRVIASADFLGNPAGLFNSVSSGVQDLFYEPLNGVVLHGTSELGVGIARGAASLVKKSAFGVTDSVSKITGSVSKGLSAAALDSNWARERQRRQFLNRNKVNGLATGTSAFVGSLASGISGIAMKPIEGAENEGAVGFLKGLGKGLVGVVAKPAVGTFDFLSNVSGGLRNATTVFDPSRAGRTRLPRHIAHDGILKPYNIREAQGQDWLRSVENGKLHSCKYVAHIELPNDVDSVCILTTTRVVMIHTNKLKIVWQIELSELKEISLEPVGIKLTLKGDHAGPFVALPDSSMKLWFFQHVKRLVKEFNDKKKRAAGVGGVQS